MAKNANKTVEKLNHLITMDIDAVSAYEAAIRRINVPMIADKLRAFQRDHQRHIKDLSQCVTRMGGTPKTHADTKGFVLKGFTAISSMMGVDAAMHAMKSNEQLTNRTYQEALKETWPDDVRAIIERNFQDEQHHLQFIEECLRNRTWETGQAAQP